MPVPEIASWTSMFLLIPGWCHILGWMILIISDQFLRYTLPEIPLPAAGSVRSISLQDPFFGVMEVDGMTACLG